MGVYSVSEPLDIGKITLPNRIVFPAFQANFATSEGFVTERLLRMYGKIAEGGSGLIMAGCVAVSDDGVPNTNALKITHDEHIAGLKALFTLIKENGAVPAAQLMHAGRQTSSAMTGYPLAAPSAIPCPVMKETPHELDKRGIERIQDDFAQGARRAKKAGAELIELHGAFGYLIGGFLSPYSNKRQDEYGRDKALFFAEIIEKVKKGESIAPYTENVRHCRQFMSVKRLPKQQAELSQLVSEYPEISVMAGRGVRRWEDAVEMLMAGANAVGIGTAAFYRDIGVFNSVCKEMRVWMEKHGYSTVKELVSKAHE